MVTELLTAGALVVGSPTINNDIYPTIAEVLCYIRGLKFENKVGGAFGSYGWSGESAKMLQGMLSEMKFKLPVPEVRLPWVPQEKDMGPVKDMAMAIAAALPQDPVGADFGL